MEENKYICPKCGAKMIAVYEKPALNLTCPDCGCKIATSKWDQIDLDDTTYEIIIKPVNEPSIIQIKFIASLTGENFIFAKNLLENGGLLLKSKAIGLKEKTNELSKNNIEYLISPNFPY